MKKTLLNHMTLELASKSINEGFSRASVSAFISQLDPTLEELTDIRTIVSEAVTNSIIHGYKEQDGVIYISVKYFDDRTVRINVRDKGCGIANINEAMKPLFTTDPGGERGGMGFTIMESFTDRISVRSSEGKGTSVTMLKRLSKK